MYDPLALDRQRIELERLRRLADRASTRYPKPRRRHQTDEFRRRGTS